MFDGMSMTDVECRYVSEVGHHMARHLVDSRDDADSAAVQCAGCYTTVCVACGRIEVEAEFVFCDSCAEVDAELDRAEAEMEARMAVRDGRLSSGGNGPSSALVAAIRSDPNLDDRGRRTMFAVYRKLTAGS